MLCDFSCDCSNSQRLGLGSVLEALYLLANVLLPSPHKVLPAAYGGSYRKAVRQYCRRRLCHSRRFRRQPSATLHTADGFASVWSTSMHSPQNKQTNRRQRLISCTRLALLCFRLQMIGFLFDFSAKQCGKSDSLSIDELCSLVRNRLRESSAVRFVSAVSGILDCIAKGLLISVLLRPYTFAALV